MNTPADTFTISRLGTKGEGLTAPPDVRAFAYTLPGEEVAVEDGALRFVKTASDRAKPFCVHFTHCGGCVGQHMPETLYAEWKRNLVVEVLKQEGIDAPVEPCMIAHGHGRRRVTLHARRSPHDQALRVGFTRAGSHEVIDLEETGCPLLVPELGGVVKTVKALAKSLTSTQKPIDAQATWTADGLDIDLRGTGKLDSTLERKLIQLSTELNLARLSLHGQVLAHSTLPRILMDGIAVPLPPGSFTQATQAGEDILANLVVEGIGKAKKVADLFAGMGTFALRLARHYQVHAVESDKTALQALELGWRHAQKLKTITTEPRDLFKTPLVPQELNRFDAVVFDPPRAGALAQVHELARSKVKKLVAVSCNPTTLARDLHVLTNGGFRIQKIVPVDQFWQSSHIETVAILSR